jgi:hypothetical protein
MYSIPARRRMKWLDGATFCDSWHDSWQLQLQTMTNLDNEVNYIGTQCHEMGYRHESDTVYFHLTIPWSSIAARTHHLPEHCFARPLSMSDIHTSFRPLCANNYYGRWRSLPWLCWLLDIDSLDGLRFFWRIDAISRLENYRSIQLIWPI